MTPYTHSLHHLKEREKELLSLYRIDKILRNDTYTLERMCYEVVSALPDAFQYPGLCEVQIKWDERSFSSPDFGDTGNRVEKPVLVDGEERGSLRVIYRAGEDERAFLPQEEQLISTLAAWLGDAIFKKELRQWFEQQEGVGASLNDQPEEWVWREEAARKMIQGLSPQMPKIAAVYLIGSVRERTAGPESDIDIVVHVKTESVITTLKAYFAGWEEALFAFPPNGIPLKQLVDVHFLTDNDLEKNLSFASMITGVNSQATRLA